MKKCLFFSSLQFVTPKLNQILLFLARAGHSCKFDVRTIQVCIFSLISSAIFAQWLSGIQPLLVLAYIYISYARPASFVADSLPRLTFSLSFNYVHKLFAFHSDIRTLVVDMVLATDMSSHFEQLRAMKATLSVLGR